MCELAFFLFKSRVVCEGKIGVEMLFLSSLVFYV